MPRRVRESSSGLVSRRRRRQQEAPLRKASFTLHEDVLEAARIAVARGDAENLSAFVEQAVEEKLRRTRRAALYAAYDEAAGDPHFLADVDAAARTFEAADLDGLGEPRTDGR